MDLRHYASVIRRRWVIIVVWVLAVALASAAYAATRPAQYVTSASLVVTYPDDVSAFGELFARSVTFPDRDIATRAQAALSDAVLSAAAQKLGEETADLSGSVTVSPAGISNGLVVTASSGEPDVGAERANAIAEAYIDELRGSQRARLAVVRKALESELADAEAEYARLTQNGSEAERIVALQMVSGVQDKLQALTVLEESDGSDTFVLKKAEPAETTSGPTPLRSGLLGATLGLVLGLVHAFTAEYLDDRLRSSSEAARLIGTKLLADGEVTHVGGRDRKRLRDADVYWLAARELATPSIGLPASFLAAGVDIAGSLDALGLARGFESQDLRVALVSTRFGSDPSAKSLGAVGSRGLGEVLTGRASLADVVRQAEGESLRFVPAGTEPPDRVQALGGSRMRALLDELRDNADVVLLEVAPLSGAAGQSAVEALAPLVDAAVLGTRNGESRTSACAAAKALSERIELPVAGVVVLGAAR